MATEVILRLPDHVYHSGGVRTAYRSSDGQPVGAPQSLLWDSTTFLLSRLDANGLQPAGIHHKAKT